MIAGIEAAWFPLVVAGITLTAIFVVAFIWHTIILHKQQRDPATPRNDYGKVPEDIAWHRREIPASRSLIMLLALLFPGTLIHLLGWWLTAEFVFDDPMSSEWEPPGWWVTAWTLIWLIAVLVYVFRPWRYAVTQRHTSVVVEYPDNWDDVRRAIYARDGHKCANCGASGVELHAHHIVPLSLGGTNEQSNLVTLCRTCHQKLHPHMRV